MDASTKRLRSHIQSKARTNRTNRVQRTANQYKGGKLSKSQQAYIDNDLKSTSSMREYGYKQAKDFKGVTYYTGGRSRQNYEKLQNGYNPYQTRYYISNHQDRNYVPGGISKATGKAYNGFYTNKRLLNKNQFGTLFTQGNLTQQAQDRVATSKDRLDNYSILRPFNANAKNFGQTLNTGVLDGLRVAQNRINKGGSKLNYVGGLAKDILVDPLVDLLKTFDRYESSALNAGLGGIQSITELADALTKKGTKLSDVNWNHARDNWQHSIETSNKEGFGDSAGESLKKIVKGTQERQLKEYKQGGNSLTNWWESKFDAKHKPGDYKGLQYQRDLHTDKNKKADELGSFVNGLILDILNPVQIGSSVMKGSSALLKKSGKEIKNGYKAGIVSDPEGLEWLNNITKKTTDKFRNGKSGAKHVDDIMHETEDAYKARKILNGVDKDVADNLKRVTAQMDNEYARQVAKADNGVKKVIDANPNTRNLSKFIDEIDASNSEQMNLWKRIKNNKYTTKDGYIPQLNRVDDVLEDTKNIEQVPGQININEIQNRPQQLDMFDQLGLSSEERFVPNSKNIAEQVQKELHPSTEKTIQQTMEEFLDYGDERKMTNLMKMLDENGEDVFKYIDELDDYHTDRMLDYLERYEPELYNKYINNIDELIDGTSNEKAMRTYQDEQAVKNIIKKPEIRNTDAIDKEYFKNSNDAYELEKIFKDNKDLNMTEIRHKKSAFTSHINEYVQRIENGDIQLKAVDSLTKRLKNANIPKSEKIKFINNNLFNGNKVISENASMKSVNSFLESLEDVHKVIQNKLDFNAGVIDNFDLNNLSKNTQNFLKNLKDTGIEGMPNEVAKSIVNRSMPLIDEQFNTKMSYLAHKFGYESIDDLRREVSQLKARRKELDNYRKTKDVIEEQTALSARIKELNNTIDARDVEWNKIKGMNEGQLQKYLMDNNETEFLSSIKNPKFNNDFLNKQVDVERDMKELGEQYADKARENSTGKSIRKDYLQGIYNKTQEQAKDMTTGIYREYVNKMAEIEKYYDNVNDTIRRANIDRIDTKYLNTDVPEYIIQYQKDLEALEQTPEVMRKLGLSNPKYKTSNATYHKSVNRGKLPEVQQNLNALKHLIEQEANIAISNQKGYEQISDALLAIKRDYVNAIQSYGVDTKLIKDNANEYLKSLVDAEKNPLKKMNLQMLASHINNQIDEITEPLTKPLEDFPIHKPENVVKPENKPNTKPHTNDIPDDMTLDDAIDDFLNNNPNYKPDVSTPKPENTPNTPKPNEPKPNTNTHQNKPRNGNKKDKQDKFDLKKSIKNNPVWDLYKRYLNTWKKGVTVYNPGWHLANFLQNKGQNYLALGTDAFKPQTQARKMLDFIKGKTDKIDDVILKDGTVLSGEDLAHYARNQGVAESAQSTQIISEPRTLLPWLDQKLDDSKLLQKLSRNEETARLHHYLTQIERGMSKEDAVKSVNKYLFDYANKSKSEKFMENFIDPFYVFHKSYAKLLGKEALTNPSKINNILRMEREMTNSTPESSRNQNASDTKFQLPFGSFTDEDNNARYDYMAKQYVFPEIQSALPLTYDDLEGKLNPLLKLAIQQMRGKGDFDTKIVDKDKAGWNEITKDDRKKEIFMDVNPFVNNLPTTINKVNKVNDRKQSKKTSDIQKMELIFNYLTGNKGKHERYLDFLK